MPDRSVRSRYMLPAAAALLVAVGVGWFLARHTVDQGPVDTIMTAEKMSEAVRSEIYLYFGDPQGRFLRAEQRILDRPADDGTFSRQLIAALIRGPEKSSNRTLPEGARLRALFVVDGRAYVDFASASFISHPGGVETELLSIYSIVNTLVVNVDAIREVKILIGGQERVTLAGHIDLQLPFVANMMWIR